jgi:hypothetical protein
MSTSDLWSKWLRRVEHDYRHVFRLSLNNIALFRRNKIDLQRAMRSVRGNLLQAQRLHSLFYPILQSGTATDAASILYRPPDVDIPADSVAMAAAPDLFLHWLNISAPEYSGVIDTCISTVDAIAQNEIEQETGLPLLEQQLRSLEILYAAMLLMSFSDTWRLKGALFRAVELVQCPVDIDFSEDCDNSSACPMMPNILALLLWTQRNQREGGAFVDVSCTSGRLRILIAPHRTERGSDWPDITAQLNQSPGDWLTAVASELANSGHSFVVRSNGQLYTFIIAYPREPFSIS